MKPSHIAFTVITVLSPGLVFAVGGAKKTVFPKTASLKVDLELKRHLNKKGEGSISGLLKISNPSGEDLIIQHPENRLVLAYLLTDSRGNVVAPRGVAKVDPAAQVMKLKAGGTYTYKFDHLWFLTGTARFGYKLKKNQNYKVIAIYRPAGSDGPGFTSNEVLLRTIP